MTPEILFRNYKEIVDAELAKVITERDLVENPIFEVMRYGILTPGKRLRGVLTLYFCERAGVPQSLALPFSVSLEMIHAYSLVHDDMPEMDNDAYRRGALTCHKKFGSAAALLAGDGLLNAAVEYLLRFRLSYAPDRFLNAMDALMHAAGAHGMLGGQILDMKSERQAPDLNGLLELQHKKTGALLQCPARIADALSGEERENAVLYCRSLGLAFQIKDDLLDIDGDPGILGKETRRDAAENKTTFITVLGYEKAKEYLQNELDKAKKYAGQDPFLLWIADYVGKRKK